MWEKLLPALVEQVMGPLKRFPFLLIAFGTLGAFGVMGWLEVERLKAEIAKERERREIAVDYWRARVEEMSKDKVKMIEDQLRIQAEINKYLQSQFQQKP